MKNAMIALFAYASVLNAAHLWIVGSDFVGSWDEKFGYRKISLGQLSSWAEDEKNCQVFITEQSPFRASKITRDEGRLIASPLPLPEGEWISAATSEEIVYLNRKKNEVIRYLSHEQTQQVFPFTQSSELTRFYSRESGVGGVGLFLSSDEKRIWVKTYDQSFLPQKEFEVISSATLWNQPKALLDNSNQLIWVGYTTNSAHFPYSPSLAAFDFTGEKKKNYVWNHKGIFFDLALTPNGILMSRDLPSAPFTLPVYSFVDEISPLSPPKPVYEAEMNYLIEHLAVQLNKVWMIARSMHSAQGSRLVVWDKSSSKTEVVASLKEPVKKLFVCNP